MKEPTFLVSFDILFPVILCLLLFAPSRGLSEPLDNWHLRNPLPTPNSLSTAASGSGVTVAVGQNGTIVASTDGVNWSLETSGTTKNLRGVAFGGGRFVAVGYEKTILTSADGITWTPVTAGIAGYLDFDGIAYGNGLFVAWGGYGAIVTSPDGEAWTRQTAVTVNGLTGIVFGKGLFVAVGYGGVILTSPDGATWRPASAGAPNHLKSVAYGDHIFVAVGSSGKIMTSADGETWTPQTSGTINDFHSITYGNAAFVAVGYGGAVLTSPDGVVWTPQTSGVNDELNNIIYSQDHFIAVGSSGVILTSTEGRTWIPRTSGVRVFFYDVIHGNNTFVAMGESGTVATSSDGLSWTSQVVGTGNDIRTGVYGNGAFIAWQWGTPGQNLTSSDGVHWGASPVELGSIPHSIVYGNGLFVAVGYGGAIRTSDDGLTWTSRTSGTTLELEGIAYGNGLFVAVGVGGAILTSPDGIDWARSTSAAGGFSNIAFGNGRFVASGSGGAIFVSTDGANWIKRSPGTGISPTDIAFGHDTFAIAGYSGNSGTIHTSSYGLLWSPKIVAQVPMLMGIAYGNDTFVAAGASGAIFQSDSLANSGTMDSAAIEALYLEMESFLAEENLGGIMALYHDGYASGGSTKAMAQASYGKMFGDYADIKAVFNLSGLAVDGDNATLTETLTWQGTRASTGEVHSRTETVKACLKKVGTAWKFYGDQVTYGATVQSGHDAWSGEFGVSVRIFDPNRTITALSVSGPGITGNLDMTSFAYDPATMSWRSISSIKAGDGSHYPSLSSLIYAVSITDARGGSVHEVAVAGLQTALTVNYAGPVNVAVRAGLTFRWVANETNSPVYYRVLLYRGTCPSPGTPPPGSPLWVSPPVAGIPYRMGSSWNEAPTSVRYSGPALPNGDYSFVVQAVDSYGNTTSAKAESFRKAVGQGSLLDVWHERNPHISLSDASSSACGNDICVYTYVYPFVKGRITAHNLAMDASWEAEVGADAALHGAAYGNSTFVVVGDGGAISVSQDAVTWSVAFSGTTNSLMRVAYGNNVFVAVGDSGTILTSPNGVAWTARSSGTIGNLSGIIYQNETFIVADASGMILTSTDGTAWTSNPAWTVNDLKMVAYGNGVFVTVDNTGTVRTSAGGENWTISTAGPGPGIDGLAYGNGIFVAVGWMAIFTSTDGIAWTPRASGTTLSLYGVRFILDRFWAVGESGTMLTSFDGVTWTSKTSGTADLLYDIAYGEGRFVAVGRYGILTSSDGQVWSVTNQEGNSDVVRIAYGNHRFIALDAYGTILTSSDGVTWMKSSIGAYDEDVRIAAAIRSVLEEDPMSGSYQGSSSDTIFDPGLSPPSSWLENQFRDIIFTGNTFVAVTSDSILTSTDGAIWTYRHRPPWGGSSDDGLKGIAYGNGTFVVVGGGGAILQSAPVWSLFQSGNLNGDPGVDLRDAVLGLQVIAGYEGSGIRPDYASSGADIDGDSGIGLAEVLYILQTVAGSR